MFRETLETVRNILQIKSGSKISEMIGMEYEFCFTVFCLVFCSGFQIGNSYKLIKC